MESETPIRVLYSFPHKLGADRICYTAWQQVNGLADAGVKVIACPGVLHKAVRPSVEVHSTLARGRLRIPYKVLGTLNACALHDYIVARRLEKLAGQIDIIHTWPLGAKRTLEAAARLGIPTVLERPNAHTRFAYQVVREECDRLDVKLPPNHEHAYKEEVLRREEEEYHLATRLLCPSEFTLQTFLDQAFSRSQLVRHFYGYDETTYYPAHPPQPKEEGLTMLFVGVCAVRKGLHFALEAWHRSTARKRGRFLIAGEFLPSYANKLAPLLSDPSVHVLGHRDDVPDLMRKSDILVLPSIEEGFGLVCTEAMASGCVPLVSEACTDLCRHGDNGLVHRVGDVDSLTQQICLLDENRSYLKQLRDSGLKLAPQITWTAAGKSLASVYRQVVLECCGHLRAPLTA